jgi:RNA polymerase sigma-70 factor (ECF subfamily)
MASTELPTDLSMPDDEDVEKKLAYLYRCIAELEETDRIILSLELEGIQQAEIAVIVGISHGNVRTKLYRIKEKLTSKFKRHGQFE